MSPKIIIQSEIYDEIIGILEKNNWKKEELSSAHSGYYKASLPKKGFLIEAQVNISSDSNATTLTLKTYRR